MHVEGTVIEQYTLKLMQQIQSIWVLYIILDVGMLLTINCNVTLSPPPSNKYIADLCFCY